MHTGVVLDGLGEYLRYSYHSAVEAAYVDGLERYQIEGGQPLGTQWMARRYGAHAVGRALLTTARNGDPSDVTSARATALRVVERLDSDGRYSPTVETAAHCCGGQTWLCRGLTAILSRTCKLDDCDHAALTERGLGSRTHRLPAESVA